MLGNFFFYAYYQNYYSYIIGSTQNKENFFIAYIGCVGQISNIRVTGKCSGLRIAWNPPSETNLDCQKFLTYTVQYDCRTLMGYCPSNLYCQNNTIPACEIDFQSEISTPEVKYQIIAKYRNKEINRAGENTAFPALTCTIVINFSLHNEIFNY